MVEVECSRQEAFLSDGQAGCVLGTEGRVTQLSSGTSVSGRGTERSCKLHTKSSFPEGVSPATVGHSSCFCPVPSSEATLMPACETAIAGAAMAMV